MEKNEEKRGIRVGGVTGIVAGILFVVAFLFSVSAPFSLGTAEALQQLSQNSAPFLISNALFLVIAVILIPLFLGLYQALREKSVASHAVVLSIIGAALLGTSSGLALSYAPALADLYAKAAPAEKQGVVTIAAAISAVTGGFFIPTGVFLSIAFIAWGAAMLESLSFHKAYGWLSVIVGIVTVLVTFAPFVVGLFVAVLALVVIWFILVGWKLYRVSRAP